MKNSNNFLFSLFTSFVCLELILHNRLEAAAAAAAGNTTKVKLNVGIVDNLDEVVGKVRFRCMSMALTDFYQTHSHYKTRVVLHPRKSRKDIFTAASAALDLLKNIPVQAIIAPDTVAQSSFLADVGHRSHVPILSASTLPTSVQNPYFFRTSQNDYSQVEAIIAILKLFGWTEAIPIYEETDYANPVASQLIHSFQESDIRIPYLSVIPSSATEKQIHEELHKLMLMQCKVFVVHLTPSLASRLFTKAKEVEMMSKGYAFIVTDSVTNVLKSFQSSTIDSMQGVLGVRPYIPKSKELRSFRAKWKRQFHGTTHLNLLQLQAYDTVWALAMAAEEVGDLSNGLLKPEVIDNSTDLTTIGVSELGPELLKAISGISFKGLSGDFHIVDRQLQASPVVEIVNVIGNQGRVIGFWSPENGIERELNWAKKTRTSSQNSKEGLRAIIWPGESTNEPQGWSFSMNGKKLRVAVPIKVGFREFVNVTDPYTNQMNVTGYSIELFEAVMKLLPYEVPYEFVPFETSSLKMNNTPSSVIYSEMLHEIYLLKKYDAVVGDYTITANRSLYVDFTIPYSETGISMIVRIEDHERKDTWVFLKPLSKGMWLTTAAVFIFTGCAIWVFEHRVNINFRGSPSQQLGMIFWFSFSTMVYAHREKLTSNLSRFVLIIWVFVVLILTASYTASLSSMLTIQRLDVSNIDKQMKSGIYIGYHSSYVKARLDRLNIDSSKLIKLRTMDEYADALSKGSKRGGVSAIVDEIPYLKLFLSKHCDKYTLLSSSYDTNGFGFAFRKGSPLAVDVSKGILQLKETQMMRTIESKWFSNITDCEDPDPYDSLASLTVARFRGLFLVTVIASSAALFIFFTRFLYQNMHILTTEVESGDDSIGNRLVNIVKLFYKVDSSNISMPCEHEQVNMNQSEGPTPTLSSSGGSGSPLITQNTDIILSDEEFHDPSPGSDNSN